MSGINKVILVGHLGKDPEVRHLEGGVTVASFPLATSETFNKDGKRVEQTDVSAKLNPHPFASAALFDNDLDHRAQPLIDFPRFIVAFGEGGLAR